MKFNIEINDEIGRHAILSENICAGDIILDELPYVIGPKHNSPVICLECYRPVNMKNGESTCLICGWPLCNDCQVKKNAHKLECELFSKENVIFHANNYMSSLIECLQLDCITPLRLVIFFFK